MTTTAITTPAHVASNSTALHDVPEIYTLGCGHPAIDGVTEVYDLPCGLVMDTVCGACRDEHDQTCTRPH